MGNVKLQHDEPFKFSADVRNWQYSFIHLSFVEAYWKCNGDTYGFEEKPNNKAEKSISNPSALFYAAANLHLFFLFFPIQSNELLHNDASCMALNNVGKYISY